jgi:hypothetical protein
MSQSNRVYGQKLPFLGSILLALATILVVGVTGRLFGGFPASTAKVMFNQSFQSPQFEETMNYA